MLVSVAEVVRGFLGGGGFVEDDCVAVGFFCVAVGFLTGVVLGAGFFTGFFGSLS